MQKCMNNTVSQIYHEKVYIGIWWYNMRWGRFSWMKVRTNKHNFVSENDIIYCIGIGVIFQIYGLIQINIRVL